MEEHLFEAISELKRLEHLIFVSLKYTRTVDVVRSAINRTIDCLEKAIDTILLYLKDKKKIDVLPKSPNEKIELMLQLFKDNESFTRSIKLFGLLRKISRARYEKKEEYRRHVTMISFLEDGTVEEFNIDRLEEMFPLLKEFILKTRKYVMEGVLE